MNYNYSWLIAFGALDGRKVRKPKKQKALEKIQAAIEEMVLTEENYAQGIDHTIVVDGLELRLTIEYWMWATRIDNGEKVKHYFGKPHIWVYHSGMKNYRDLHEFCLSA